MAHRIITLFLLLGCLACVRTKPSPEPESGPVFQILNFKISFSDGHGRQSGRVNWRFDSLHAKFLFFTPLNQVGLELAVAGESALLLHRGRKLYWRGDFARLLDRLWGIELSLAELKKLLLEGTVPEGKIKENGMTIDLEKGAADPAPRLVTIRQNNAILTIRIMTREIRAGRIVPFDPNGRFHPAALEDVLSDD